MAPNYAVYPRATVLKKDYRFYENQKRIGFDSRVASQFPFICNHKTN